jgi:AcrR family transcriptional regulator
MRLVFTQGLDGLTMQRLATEVDCAVGSVYTYFPSKSALVAELQRAAIEVLDDSCADFEARFDREVGQAEVAPDVHRLALVVGYARFWVDTFETFPEEARLMQRLMSDASHTVADEDVSRVLPVALRLLDRVRVALATAADGGALEAGDALQRTVVLAASLNGVLLLGHIARVDPELFDPGRQADALVRDLLRGWGADPQVLHAARQQVTALAEAGPLAARAVAAPDDDKGNR